MLRRNFGLCTAALSAMLLQACVIDGSERGANAPVETQTQAAIDLDAAKEGALGLIFGMPQIDDRLDVPSNDSEDWRYIIVTEEGVITITINLDSPGQLEGGWKIIDAEDRTLHRQAFNRNQGFYEFRDFPVLPGVYFFQIFATEGKSIYTIASDYRPTPRLPVVEPVVEATPEPRRRSSTSTRNETATPPPEPKAPKSGPAKRVVGFVSLITPKPDGSAEITIRRAGKNTGVEAGHVGVIQGTKMRIETTVCFATSCRAIIPENANPKSLKEGADVVFDPL